MLGLFKNIMDDVRLLTTNNSLKLTFLKLLKINNSDNKAKSVLIPIKITKDEIY